MDDNELGAWEYYYGKLWKYWSDECTKGNITEEEMENKLDRYEGSSVKRIRNSCRRLGLRYA